MNYKVKLIGGAYGSAEIVELPDVYLHFAQLDFATVWNKETKHYESVHGVNTFYGGMGEGSSFKTWQDAILSSLYDAYQCYDELKEGDTFEVEYLGEIAHYACEGVHVFNTDRVDPQTKALIEAEVFGEYDNETDAR